MVPNGVWIHAVAGSGRHRPAATLSAHAFAPLAGGHTRADACGPAGRCWLASDSECCVALGALAVAPFTTPPLTRAPALAQPTCAGCSCSPRLLPFPPPRAAVRAFVNSYVRRSLTVSASQRRQLQLRRRWLGHLHRAGLLPWGGPLRHWAEPEPHQHCLRRQHHREDGPARAERVLL